MDAVLVANGDQPIFQLSTRDPWWGVRPVADRYKGRNVFGRLWSELRQQLRDGDPAARSGACRARIRVSRLAGGPVVPGAVLENQ